MQTDRGWCAVAIVTLVKPEHYTESTGSDYSYAVRIVTPVKLVQPQNAFSPMLVIPLEIVRLSSWCSPRQRVFLQYWRRHFDRDAVQSGAFIKSLLTDAGYTTARNRDTGQVGTTIECTPPMLVTLLGIVTLLRL